MPPLAGPATEAEAITVCDDLDEWIAALRTARGNSRDGDRELRSWALGRDERVLLEPIRSRMRELGADCADAG